MTQLEHTRLSHWKDRIHPKTQGDSGREGREEFLPQSASPWFTQRGLRRQFCEYTWM